MNCSVPLTKSLNTEYLRRKEHECGVAMIIQLCQLLLLLSQKSNTKWVVVQHQCYKMLVPRLSVLICRFDCCTGLFILGDNKILVSLFSFMDSGRYQLLTADDVNSLMMILFQHSIYHQVSKV